MLKPPAAHEHGGLAEAVHRVEEAYDSVWPSVLNNSNMRAESSLGTFTATSVPATRRQIERAAFMRIARSSPYTLALYTFAYRPSPSSRSKKMSLYRMARPAPHIGAAGSAPSCTLNSSKGCAPYVAAGCFVMSSVHSHRAHLTELGVL